MPTEEDCDRNKQHVILATYRCFKRYGIDGTTQKRIAQEACLTPRSIQRYFKDRDELTLETTIYMLRLYDDYVHAYIARKKQPGMTALDEVLLYLECQKEIYLERPGFFLLLNEMDVYYKRHKLHYKALVPKLKQQETMRPFLQSILSVGLPRAVSGRSWRSRSCGSSSLRRIQEYFTILPRCIWRLVWRNAVGK